MKRIKWLAGAALCAALQGVAAPAAGNAGAEAQAIASSLLSGERTGCTALTEPGAGSDFAAITTTAIGALGTLALRAAASAPHPRHPQPP